MRKKNRTTLAKQLFSNYILLLMLIIGLFVLSFLGNSFFAHNFLDKSSINTGKFYKAVDTYGLDYAVENYYVPEDAEIEILDEDLKIIESYNSPKKLGAYYNRQDFYNIVFEKAINGFAYYLESSNQILVIHVSEVYLAIRVLKSILFTVILFLALFVLAMVLFSKYTSLHIIKPVKALLDGVYSISKGQYDYKIAVPANNELEDLRLAINELSSKLKIEIALKEKAEKSRQQLILDITHDLKTPITNIMGYCETLKELDCKDKGTCEKYLDIIIQNSHKANQMAQDLFELSQLESTDFNLDKRPFDFGEFLREVMISFIPAMEQKHMELDIDMPEEDIWVEMDKLKMERAIGNLFSNAIKYAGEGTVINVFLRCTEDSLKLIVKDNGAGIPEAYNESIFEPFVRLDPSRNSKTGGTGLGLAITKKIIERHGGSIVLESQINEGCTFTVDFQHICILNKL